MLNLRRLYDKDSSLGHLKAANSPAHKSGKNAYKEVTLAEFGYATSAQQVPKSDIRAVVALPV